ncbi:MAG: amidohydrolase family protein [Gemmatimonadetes bacterium]|jgi:imidazolonepropionase-like amidohydrolase|nr:amidohydrolase family protein [Gemmatimonadota bacterium]
MRRLPSPVRVSTLLLLFVCARIAHAQSPAASPSPSLPSSSSSAPVVLRAQRLIVGDGTTIDQPVVIVQGDRIIAAGPASSVAVPRGARVIDLPGHTLLPGLIDSHTHINSSDSDGGDMAVLRETGAHAAIYGVVNAKKTLDAGFTTIRDVGATNHADIALRDLIAKGVVPGPRIFAAGPSLGITGGHADVNGWSPLIQIPGTGMIVDGVEGMRKAVRQNIKFGSDHIKITATGGILSVGDAVNHAQYSEEELRAAVEEAARLGRKVAMHAHGAEGIVTAVRAGAASIEHGSLIDDAGIALMKEKGTFLVPTLIILDEIARDGEQKGVPANSIAKARAIEGDRRVRLRKAWQAGVRFAFGTDATGDIHGRNAQEFALMVEKLGATPMQAIVTATSNAATLLGAQADLGTVAAGKFADIIAVAGNPLDDVRRLERVDFVMKVGTVYKSPAAATTR